jgi:hypothetical protein
MYEMRKKMNRTWWHIRDRCYRKTDKSYRDYGARGITMCDRWLTSFSNFYDDVSKLPNFGKDGYSLNRIDNNGNYEPGNVEWVDFTAQQNNKRNNRLITYSGKTQTLGQWAKELGLNYSLTWWRMYRLGWSAEEAFIHEKYPMYHERGSKSCTH